jgi:hypothetical protein
VIVGYTVQDGEVTGLVTARIDGDELRYTGLVPLAKDSTVKEDLLARFEALKAKSSVFPDLNVRAVWLRPQLSCEVESTASGNTILKDPQFKGLVFPKAPQPVRLSPQRDDTPKIPTTKGATTKASALKSPAQTSKDSSPKP